MAIQDGRQHERLVQQGRDPLLVRLDSDDAVLGEGSRSVRKQPDRLEEVLDEDGLENVELTERKEEDNQQSASPLKETRKNGHKPQTVRKIQRSRSSCCFPSPERPPSSTPRTGSGSPFQA